MTITESYQKAASAGNAKLFKNVSVRIGSMLLREQTYGFVEGFSSETKGGTGAKARHGVFEVRCAAFSSRKAQDPKLKDYDFSIYISAAKEGPVSVALFPGGHKARGLLSKVVGNDRMNEVKGPHVIHDTTSKEFQMTLEILASVITRAGKIFHRNAANEPAP